MSITAAIQLSRVDPYKPQTTFGYENHWAMRHMNFWRPMPISGFELSRPDNAVIKPSLVKLIEYYPISRKSDIFIERLCYQIGNQLHPFKARYIRRDKPDKNLLFTYHVESIANTISKTGVEFYTPTSFYINAIPAPTTDRRWLALESIGDIYRENTMLIECVADEEEEWSDVMDLVDAIVNEEYLIWRDRWQVVHGDYNQICKMIKPKIPFLDPMTAKYYNKPIKTIDIAVRSIGGKRIDTTPPEELSIDYPNITSFSHRDYVSTYSKLRKLKITDATIGYILSGGAVVDKDVHLLLDRYERESSEDDELLKCDDIIREAALEAANHTKNDIFITGDVYVAFQMTFNDEAMIEFFEYDTSHPIHVCYVDLAMLSLCSTSLAHIPVI